MAAGLTIFCVLVFLKGLDIPLPLIGPWFGGAVFDATGSYRMAFVTAIGFCGLASGCFWMAGGRPKT